MTTRRTLIDRYKDGYRVVAEALAGATDERARRASGAGQVVGARDRASSRRQRDDVGDPPAAAARRDQPGHRRLRPGRVRAAAVLRPADRGVARRVQGRAADDGRDPGAADRRRVARAKGRTPSIGRYTVETLARDLRRRTPTSTPSRSRVARDAGEETDPQRPQSTAELDVFCRDLVSQLVRQYSRNRLADRRRIPATPSSHDRAMSRAGDPALDLFAQLGRSGEDVDRQLLVLVFVRADRASGSARDRRRETRAISATPVSTARNVARSST